MSLRRALESRSRGSPRARSLQHRHRSSYPVKMHNNLRRWRTVRWSAAVISPFGAAGQGIEATLKVAADIRDGGGGRVYGQPAAKAA